MDRVYFHMPIGGEMFLAALAVVQDYAKQLAARKQDVEFTIHLSTDKFAYLQPCFPKNCNVMIGDYSCHPVRGLYDYVFDFELAIDDAYRIACPTNKHVTEVLGLLVGASPMSIPDVTALPRPEPTQAVLTLSEYDAQDIEGSMKYMLEHALIVGPQCYLTYLACAFGRGVIEIVPTDKHRNWLSKWLNPFYVMVYGMPDQRMLEQGAKNLWARMARSHRIGGLPTQTAQFKYTVASVGGTSPIESTPRSPQSTSV